MLMNRLNQLHRRNFLRGIAAGGSASMIMAGQDQTTGSGSAASALVPKKPLGKTGVQVSAIGVGGFHLGSAKHQAETNQIVAQAIEAGINFFDNAWDYHEG